MSRLGHLFPKDAPANASTAADEAAAVLRAQLGLGDTSPLLDLEPLLAAGNFRVQVADLQPERGGYEALLIPLRNDGFRIVVDPTPPDGWDHLDERARAIVHRRRLRFRVAHEVAHGFFYERSSDRPPHRALPPNATEEH